MLKKGKILKIRRLKGGVYVAICEACGLTAISGSCCEFCKSLWERDIASNNLPPGLEGFTGETYTLHDYIWLWRYKRKYDQDQFMRKNYIPVDKEFTETEMLAKVCEVIVMIKYRATMGWQEALTHIGEISRNDVKDYLDRNIEGRYSFLQSPISF